MTSPLRRPPTRDDLGIETTLRRAAAAAPEYELGWSALRQAMRDAGWPARTPEHDRRPGNGNGEAEPACIDYNDPTGDTALEFNRLIGDLESLQDHWHLVATSLRAIALITRAHMPVATPAIPACSITSCGNHVEFTPGGGFRGMERIAGIWVAKPGVRVLCSRHRTQERRAS